MSQRPNEPAPIDLCATVIALTPRAPATIPANQGAASHAFFLRLVSQADPALAAQLHEGAQSKPFTCSNLWPAAGATGDRRGGRLAVRPGETWQLRYTTLNAELTQLWLDRALTALPETVTLGDAIFHIQSAHTSNREHPSAGRASYADLAAPYLLGSDSPPTRWRFAFRAPTAFRSGGMTVPIPLPDLLFGSLLDRWNAWSPVALNPETRRFAGECIAISRYHLHSESLLGKGRRVQRGAVGRCTYAALNRDRYWCSAISTLAAFAFYGGAGYQTTQGMGVCRWLDG